MEQAIDVDDRQAPKEDHFYVIGGRVYILCEILCNQLITTQWTIPQLDKVLNWKRIVAQLERAS